MDCRAPDSPTDGPLLDLHRHEGGDDQERLLEPERRVPGECHYDGRKSFISHRLIVVGLGTSGFLFLGLSALTHVTPHDQIRSGQEARFGLATARDLAVLGLESESEDTDRPWSTFWRQSQSTASRGDGSALHARGLIALREGRDLCLHTKKGFGSAVFMGPCEEAVYTQQWEYNAATGQIMHEFAGCLDGGGDTLHMWSCDGSNPSQRWTHRPTFGHVVNEDQGTCLDKSQLGDRHDFSYLSLCGMTPFQQWDIGVRLGSVQLWTGNCLWADRYTIGGQLLQRRCSDREKEWWRFSPSTGQLRHRNSSLCAAAADSVAVLVKCSTGDDHQHWTHNAMTGQFTTVDGMCLDGSNGGLALKACVQGGYLDQRWSTGVRTGQLEHNYGLCLHGKVERGKTSAAVALGACEVSKEHQWGYDDAVGTIKNLDGQCLQIVGGRGVTVGACREDLWGQQWVYDSYTETIRHGNQCLEALSPNENGAKVQLEVCIAKHWRQKWSLTSRAMKTTIYTVESRDKNVTISMHGVAGRTIRNVGLGVAWHGFKTKVDSYSKAVKALARTSPEEIVILTDTDVAYGGCGEEELLRRYRSVVENSGGATVVTAADANQFPRLKDGVERFRKLRQERSAVLSAFGLVPDDVDLYCARDWNGTVAIAIEYGFVNSGFIMGPAKDMQEVLGCMKTAGWNQTCLDNPQCSDGVNMTRRSVAGAGVQCCFDDQRALSRCALKHPDKITIDYTGTIMMTTYGMHNMFKVTNDSIINNISNTTQCFVHANCWDWSQPMKWDAWMDKLKGVFKGAV